MMKWQRLTWVLLAVLVGNGCDSGENAQQVEAKTVIAHSESATTASSDNTGGLEGFEIPADCATVSPPVLGTTDQESPALSKRQDPLTALAQGNYFQVENNYVGVFGREWPAGDVKKQMRVDAGSYISIPFIANPISVATGRVQWELSADGTAPVTVSLSRCPGDFSDALGPCRAQSDLLIIYTNDPSLTNRCILEPYGTYFLNAINAFESSLQQTQCKQAACGVLITS